MTLSIPSPRQHINDNDMQIECEQALADGVHNLVDEAIIAGWPPEVVFAALKSVVANRELAYIEDPDPARDP